MDARIAELRFLTDLAEQVRDIQCRHDTPPNELYELEFRAFRDLVLELLLEGCLNGTASLPIGGRSGFLDRNASVMQAFNEIVEGRPTRVAINHRGRLRLARLRTELQANRLRDKFGILFDQRHLERDLLIATLGIRDGEPLSLVMADLDHFKAINDTLTYADGDAALRRYFSTADQVLGAVGEVYCRGGDEVLAILPRISGARAAELAETVRAAVEAEFASKPDDRLKNQPTISVGVASTTRRVGSAELEKQVTDALHAAKDAGKNRVVVRSPSE